MFINYTNKLHQDLIAIAEKVEFKDSCEFLMIFDNSVLSSFCDAIKKANTFPSQIEANMIIDDINVDILEGFNFDDRVESILTDLENLENQQNFSVVFKPSYVYKNLNRILKKEKKEIIRLLCFAIKGASQIIHQDENSKIIKLDLEDGMQKMSDGDILAFIDNDERIDQRMNDIIRKFLSFEIEKINILNQLDLEREKILNSY